MALVDARAHLVSMRISFFPRRSWSPSPPLYRSFSLLPLALLALVFGATTVAAGDTLSTDAVTYCAEAKAVIVDEFDIAYHRSNSSITFSFSLASVESNLNVSANLYVNVYGIEAVNQTFDLCSYFEGVICPLPQVNFTGYGTYPIPSKYTKDIPAIAYHVPNLEAYARIELIRDSDGSTAACLQATLTNGWTTKQKGVQWSTGIFTLVALLVGLLHSALGNSPSPAQYRWFDILFLFQAAGASGFMHLNYPSVYSAFTQNFHWALGLFYSSNMQSSINKMRAKTGGTQSGAAYSDVQYIDRKLSPFNEAIYLPDALQTTSSFKSFIAENTLTRRTAAELVKRATIPSTIDQNATTELDTGIPVYVNTLNIPTANAFDTVFFVFLIFCAVFIAAHVLFYATVLLVDRFHSSASWATRVRRVWWAFCLGNALWLALIWFTPLWIFGFFQYKVGDSRLSIFFAVLAMLLTLVPLATTFLLSIRRTRFPSSTAPTISPLYTSYKWFHSAGAIYRQYRQRFHYFWFAPIVLAMIARSAFIALGPVNGWAQVIGCVIVELILFVSLLACRPHKDRKGDWIVAFLSFCRLCAFGLLIAFIPSIGVGAIARTVIGLVIVVLFGVPTILLFLGLIWNAGYGYLWRRHTHRIEDGLEVERFVASDPSLTGEDLDPQQRAMAQYPNQPASTYPFLAANPSPPSSSDQNHTPSSLGRRASIMEPVENVYEPSIAPSQSYSRPNSNNWSGEYPNGYTSPPMSPTGPTSPISPRSPIAGRSAEDAYAEAAGMSRPQSSITTRDRLSGYAPAGGAAPMMSQPGLSRATTATSGTSHYYTPGGMTATPMTGREQYFTPSAEPARDQYFNANGAERRSGGY